MPLQLDAVRRMDRSSFGTPGAVAAVTVKDDETARLRPRQLSAGGLYV